MALLCEKKAENESIQTATAQQCPKTPFLTVFPILFTQEDGEETAVLAFATLTGFIPQAGTKGESPPPSISQPNPQTARRRCCTPETPIPDYYSRRQHNFQLKLRPPRFKGPRDSFSHRETLTPCRGASLIYASSTEAGTHLGHQDIWRCSYSTPPSTLALTALNTSVEYINGASSTKIPFLLSFCACATIKYLFHCVRHGCRCIYDSRPIGSVWHHGGCPPVFIPKKRHPTRRQCRQRTLASSD